ALRVRHDVDRVLTLVDEVLVDRAAGRQAFRARDAALAVPGAALVLADALLREDLHADVGGRNDARARGRFAGGGDVHAHLGVVAGADAFLRGLGEVGQHGLGVELAAIRNGFTHVHAGDFAEQAEQVGGVDHVRHFARSEGHT